MRTRFSQALTTRKTNWNESFRNCAGLVWTLLVVVSCLATVSPEVRAQSTGSGSRRSNSQIIRTKAKLFLNYSKDFIDFAKSHKNEGLEYETTLDLHLISQTMSDRMDSASTIMQMYETVLCKEDRTSLVPIVKDQLQYYSKETEVDIEQTNIDLAYVKSTAAAQLGLRMKDDLRDVKETLDSMERTLQ